MLHPPYSGTRHARSKQKDTVFEERSVLVACFFFSLVIDQLINFIDKEDDTGTKETEVVRPTVQEKG